MEARGIEPLSEDQIAAFSPSAVYLLNFPLSAADKRAGDIGSFIVPVLPQSLGRPVPHIDDAACRSREHPNTDPSKDMLIVSSIGFFIVS